MFFLKTKISIDEMKQCDEMKNENEMKFFFH